MDFNLYQTLGQVSSEAAAKSFRDHLRGCVRKMIGEVLTMKSMNFAARNTNRRTAITFVPAAALAMSCLKAIAGTSFDHECENATKIVAAKEFF